ncbi:MAG TPA: cation transporter [Microlunatus sp.]
MWTRESDARHPMGYGKEAYVWSMFAAFGLFTAGAVVSISHGISELRNPEPATDYLIAYVVLGIAFVLEGSPSPRRADRSESSWSPRWTWSATSWSTTSRCDSDGSSV